MRKSRQVTTIVLLWDIVWMIISPRSAHSFRSGTQLAHSQSQTIRFLRVDECARLMGRQSFHSGRSLFSVAPPMCSLDIVRMIVSPSSSHSLGILMVRDDIAIVCELFMADGTFPVLLDNLSVQHLSHFGWLIGVPDILSGGEDLRRAAHRVLPTWA